MLVNLVDMAVITGQKKPSLTVWRTATGQRKACYRFSALVFIMKWLLLWSYLDNFSRPCGVIKSISGPRGTIKVGLMVSWLP